MHARLIEINPEYEADFASVLDEREDDVEARHSLDKRDDVLCSIFPLAKVSAVKDGIKHLRKIKGQPQTKAGHGICVRVSCSYKAAIWWCNDVSSPIKFGGGGVWIFVLLSRKISMIDF